jgi:outer membrane lipase/esterase
MNRYVRHALLGIVLASATTLASAAPSQIFIFGDSLSDSGNNTIAIAAQNGNVPKYEALPIANNAYVPTYTYASSGTYSDGQVWATRFASALGVPLVNSLATSVPGLVPPSLVPYSTNYAFGGATTGGSSSIPSLSDQVQMALAARSNVLPSSALYVVAGGGNDARAIFFNVLPTALGGGDFTGALSVAVSNYVLNIHNIINNLKTHQASNIVLWNTPNLGLTPALLSGGPQASGLATLIAARMNQALVAEMAAYSSLYSGLASTSLPGVNSTDACAAIANCDPSKYFYWDGIHPSSLGHQILADRMVAFVPVPGTLLLILPLALFAVGAKRKRTLAA